jgi:hypothetical protein
MILIVQEQIRVRERYKTQLSQLSLLKVRKSFTEMLFRSIST